MLLVLLPSQTVCQPGHLFLSTNKKPQQRIPWQVGVLEFHFPSGLHVMEASPTSLYPSSHLKRTLAPTVKSSPFREPCSGDPGFSHLETVFC